MSINCSILVKCVSGLNQCHDVTGIGQCQDDLEASLVGSKGEDMSTLRKSQLRIKAATNGEYKVRIPVRAFSVRSRSQTVAVYYTIFKSSEEEIQDPVMLGNFLDFLTQDVTDNPSKLVPYTKEMSARAKKLVSGVTLDE